MSSLISVSSAFFVFYTPRKINFVFIKFHCFSILARMFAASSRGGVKYIDLNEVLVRTLTRTSQLLDNEDSFHSTTMGRSTLRIGLN